MLAHADPRSILATFGGTLGCDRLPTMIWSPKKSEGATNGDLGRQLNGARRLSSAHSGYRAAPNRPGFDRKRGRHAQSRAVQLLHGDLVPSPDGVLHGGQAARTKEGYSGQRRRDWRIRDQRGARGASG